jgi:hypothetical protein
MKFAILAGLAMIIGVVNAAHADCTGTGCATDEPTATKPPRANYPCNGSSCATLQSRIDNALKDLEIANAHALKADRERLNALCATVNCTSPEPTKSPSDR